MSIKHHKSEARGYNKFDWLDSWHTFSFGRFVDRERMGFRSLRVINEDIIAPCGGFPTHPHDNMEIITYVVDGALAHKDSMGTGSVIAPGEVQKMSAGTGVTHSEFNASNDNPAHILQIWIKPDRKDIAPEYQQVTVQPVCTLNQLCLIGSPAGESGTVKINQDARLYVMHLQTDKSVTHEFAEGRYGFLQIVKGKVETQGRILNPGDGLEIGGVDSLEIKALEDSEALLFDLA